MKFQSTRDLNKTKYDSAFVIKQGLASDGGLFVPESIPQITNSDIENYCSLPYPSLAAEILSKFLADYTYDELLNDAQSAYSENSFKNGACKIHKVNKNTFSLELWHGPTCAFKDMALQIMPRLLSRSLTKTNENRTALVLTATSGDTGKAALEGYKNVDGIKICVFFPENGVSEVQKLQMTTQDGENVHVCAVKGNFDDIQSEVKRIFSNDTIKSDLDEKGYFLSSANSINFGRLAPQIVYYVKAYCDLLKNGEIELGEKINVCVPTGNFGNILAAYIAKLMGLPIDKLICASNSNNILTDFLSTGRYDRNRDFHLTISPSMDILISSNLERLLYLIAGAEKTANWMKSLAEKGYYEVDETTLNAIQENFIGYYADENATRSTIKTNYNDNAYLVDTHTAVALYALDEYRSYTKDTKICAVASTASPYKFANNVYGALFDTNQENGLSSLIALSDATKTEIPENLACLQNKKVIFSNSVTPENMYNEVSSFIEK